MQRVNLFHNSDEEACRQRRLRLFEKSWLSQEKLEAISACVGAIDGLSVLDVGSLGGWLGHFSRGKNADWICADFSPESAERIRSLAGDPVVALGEGPWPFEDGSFDRVLLVDRLTDPDESRLRLMEAHRVLREKGQLIVMTPRRISAAKHSIGFTEQELLSLVRDGFDVQEVRGFIRGLGGRLHRMIDRHLAKMSDSLEDICSDPHRTDEAFIYLSRLYPLCWIASRLDRWLPLTRYRYHLLRARRRPVWRSRAAPRLADGRSIADAAINTRIGSAAEF